MKPSKGLSLRVKVLRIAKLAIETFGPISCAMKRIQRLSAHLLPNAEQACRVLVGVSGLGGSRVQTLNLPTL